MREAWDSLEPAIDARRFREVQEKLAIHEADAADWRDTCVSYWQQFSGRPTPTDDGPLSAKIVVDGQTRVAADHRRPPGRSRRAVVKVTKNDFFGPIVKNDVFELRPPA